VPFDADFGDRVLGERGVLAQEPEGHQEEPYVLGLALVQAYADHAVGLAVRVGQLRIPSVRASLEVSGFGQGRSE
jgi:hypothetical protein